MTPAPAARPMTATIATIAHEVVVSMVTVSEVLNGRYDVAAETPCPGRGEHRAAPLPPQPAVGRRRGVIHDLAWAMQIIRGVEAATPMT